MPVNAPFYVKATNGTLVPAKFMIGVDGNPVVNPNSTPNPVYSEGRLQYYTADGQVIENANPSNYLVVPYNYSLQTTANFVQDVDWVDEAPGSGLGYMIAAFIGSGSQNLQRTYMNSDGTMTQAGADVPMFQDAASFTLGIASQMGGYGPLPAEVGGSLYAIPALAGGPLGLVGSWNNNARNMNSISSGATFIQNQNLQNLNGSSSPLGSVTIDDSADGALSYNTTGSAAAQLAAAIYPVPSSQSASSDGGSAPTDPNASARADLTSALASQLNGVTGAVQIAQATDGSLVVTSNSGVMINLKSDLSGSKTVPTDGAGSFVQTNFDGSGNTQSTLIQSVTNSTDVAGQVFKTLTATTLASDGHVISTVSDTQQFDAAGTLTSETMVDADGSQTVYARNGDGSSTYSLLNASGQLTQTTQIHEDGSYTDSVYDPATGMPTGTASFNASGAQTEFRQFDSDGSTVTTTYDSFADPNLTTVVTTDASGTVTQTATTVAGANSDTYDTTITDASGNLLSTQTSVYADGTLQSQSTYDTNGQLTQTTEYDSDGSVSSTTVNSYDSSGALTGATMTVYAADGAVVYTEDQTYSADVLQSDTITAGNDVSFSVTGNDVTVNAGTGDDISVVGQSDIINASNDTVSVSGAVSATINGGDDQISYGTAGASLDVTGSGNSITGVASGSLTLSGQHDDINAADSTISTTSGSSLTLGDDGDVVTGLPGGGVTLDGGISATLDGVAQQTSGQDASETFLYNSKGQNDEDLINLADGGSQEDLFAGATYRGRLLPTTDSEIAFDWSGQNEAGTETSQLIDYSNGTSAETLYAPRYT